MMMDTMESSFYNNNTMKKSILKSVKSNMTLDFNGGSARSKQKKISDLLLNSPDINMLKLASPELERLIIQQGNVTTTPTPTTQILFPKSVTEEQEAYARGFVDALAELHHDEEEPEPQSTYTTLTTVSNGSNSAASHLNATVPSQAEIMVCSSGPVVSAPQTANGIYSYSTVTQLPGSVFSSSSPATSTATVSTTSMGMNGSHAQEILVHNNPMSIPRNTSHTMQFPSSAEHSQMMQIKEEPQRVPCLSPQLTPIDMGAQEGIKLERKRARNRVAARKCRTRKLERISRLEDRVSELKGHNGTLVQSANELREQVMALKQQILEHVNSGCKVMLSANML